MVVVMLLLLLLLLEQFPVIGWLWPYVFASRVRKQVKLLTC